MLLTRVALGFCAGIALCHELTQCIYLAKSGKLNTNCAKDYDIILPEINGNKKSHVASVIMYLQRSADKEKLIRILEVLSDMKQVPFIGIREATEYTGTERDFRKRTAENQKKRENHCYYIDRTCTRHNCFPTRSRVH